MTNTLKDSIQIGVVLLFIILAFVVFQQGKAIAALERLTLSPSVNPQTISSAETTSNQIKANENQVKTLMESQTSIVGIIKSITGDTMVIETSVQDAALIKKTDATKPFSVKDITKSYTVTLKTETAYVGKKLSELQSSDRVSVTSKLPILEIDAFDAVSITYNDTSKMGGAITK